MAVERISNGLGKRKFQAEALSPLEIDGAGSDRSVPGAEPNLHELAARGVQAFPSPTGWSQLLRRKTPRAVPSPMRAHRGLAAQIDAVGEVTQVGVSGSVCP